MRYGLVLVKTDVTPPKEILKESAGIEGILDSYAVFSRFDIVVF